MTIGSIFSILAVVEADNLQGPCDDIRCVRMGGDCIRLFRGDFHGSSISASRCRRLFAYGIERLLFGAARIV
jgi:hypothetical protein